MGLVARLVRAAGRRENWVAGLSSFGLGALLSVSLAPMHILLSLPVAFGGIGMLALWARTSVQAAAIGWLIGLGYFSFGLSWIVEPFQIDAARYAWMAPFALVFLAAGLALFWSLAFGLAARWSRGGPRLLVLIALWTLAEFGRAYLLTGFPWAGFGQFWIETPAAQLLPLVGAQGLSLLMLVVLLPLALVRRRPLLAIAPLLLVALGGYALPPPAALEMTTKRVRLVQPNAPQAEKWLAERRWDFVRRAVELSETSTLPDQPVPDQFAPDQPAPDLIIWPETAVPQLLNNAQDTLSAISSRIGPVPLLLGIQRRQENRYYNSAVLLDAAGAVTQTYDKAHLVPFGEYVPFGDLMARFGIYGFAAQSGAGYSAGPGPALLDLGIGLAMPLICYEAVFAQDVNAVPRRPDMLIQITNDAWFGTRSGPYQHLVQARMRAAEQGLPMLRAANTGITAMIDPYGRMRERIPLGQAGAVDSVLPAPLPPTLYSRTGDWPVFVLSLLLLLSGAKLQQRVFPRS